MIRKAELCDIEELFEIWFTGITQYNKNVTSEFWYSKKEIIKGYLKDKEVFLYEDKDEIKGFLCYEKNESIIALFVKKEFQNMEIGSNLLDYIKKTNEYLNVSILEDNLSCNNFFIKNGFVRKYSQNDINTECKEIFYEWRYYE